MKLTRILIKRIPEGGFQPPPGPQILPVAPSRETDISIALCDIGTSATTSAVAATPTAATAGDIRGPVAESTPIAPCAAVQQAMFEPRQTWPRGLLVKPFNTRNTNHGAEKEINENEN